MGSKEELSLLYDQLEGLAKAVASDPDYLVNKDDYLTTLNSLKNRIAIANRVPDTDDLLIGGTKTGRTSSMKPRPSIPWTGDPSWEEMQRANPAMNPLTNRRAAIEHTRKLNELGDDS